jgi:hypothetical protein
MSTTITSTARNAGMWQSSMKDTLTISTMVISIMLMATTWMSIG